MFVFVWTQLEVNHIRGRVYKSAAWSSTVCIQIWSRAPPLSACQVVLLEGRLSDSDLTVEELRGRLAEALSDARLKGEELQR